MNQIFLWAAITVVFAIISLVFSIISLYYSNKAGEISKKLQNNP